MRHHRAMIQRTVCICKPPSGRSDTPPPSKAWPLRATPPLTPGEDGEQPATRRAMSQRYLLARRLGRFLPGRARARGPRGSAITSRIFSPNASMMRARIADGGGGVATVATHVRHKSLQAASRLHRPAWSRRPRDQHAGELMEARARPHLTHRNCKTIRLIFTAGSSTAAGWSSSSTR